jgi:hypothetical protein
MTFVVLLLQGAFRIRVLRNAENYNGIPSIAYFTKRDVFVERFAIQGIPPRNRRHSIVRMQARNDGFIGRMVLVLRSLMDEGELNIEQGTLNTE